MANYLVIRTSEDEPGVFLFQGELPDLKLQLQGAVWENQKSWVYTLIPNGKSLQPFKGLELTRVFQSDPGSRKYQLTQNLFSELQRGTVEQHRENLQELLNHVHRELRREKFFPTPGRIQFEEQQPKESK